MSPLLFLEGIGKAFGGVQALDDVSFAVDEGEVFGLIGPNGAGKTTLFNIVTGTFPPSRGRVVFRGEDLSGKAPHQVTGRGIGRTFQNIRLFGAMTVAENVMAGMHCRTRSGVLRSVLRTRGQRAEETRIREKAASLLALVGLAGTGDDLPGSLPYGHQRRLEIARALASEPRLLLLDEPAAGMNDSETGEVRALIGALKGMGITILLIEHDMSLVMRACDRIAVLSFGRRIAVGTPEAVRADPAVIEAYLGRAEDADA